MNDCERAVAKELEAAKAGIHVWIMGPGAVTEMAQLDRELDAEHAL